MLLRNFLEKGEENETDWGDLNLVLGTFTIQGVSFACIALCYLLLARFYAVYHEATYLLMNVNVHVLYCQFLLISKEVSCSVETDFFLDSDRDMTEPAKIQIRQIRIL